MPSRGACADASLELNRHIINLLDSLSALSGLTTIPIRDLDEAALLKHALEALMGNQDMERCSIFLLGDDGCLTNVAGLDWADMLDGIARHEAPVDRPARATTCFRVGEGLIGRAAASRMIEHCRSCKDDARFEQTVGKSVEGSLLCVPIVCEEGVLGVLNVYHPAAGFFDLWHERLLLLFCQVLGRLLLHHRFTHHLGMLVARKTEELEHQRHFLQTVLDSAPEPMMVIGRDYRVLLTNRPGGAEPRYCYRISHHRDSPCDSAEHPCPLRTVLETRQVATVIHEHFNEAGEPRLVELLASPLQDATGEIVGIIESARDITERKRIADALQKSEEAIRESEERFRTIADYTYDWEYWQGPNKEIIYMSPSCEGMTGYAQAEFMADSSLLGRIIHPDDQHLMRKHIVDFACQDEDAIDFRIVRRDGEIRWIAHGCRPIYGENGQFRGRRANNRDITERKQVEAALHESQARLHDLFENMSDGVAVYQASPDGRSFIFTALNSAAERIDNVRREDLIGKSVMEVFPGVKEFGLLDVFQRVWRSGVAEHFPVSFYQDERLSGWRENFVYKLPGGEIVAIFDDITERKKLEEELERLAHTDCLTGLANRRHFLEQAEQELARAVRYGKHLSVLMVDIDHFKRVNDIHGHNAGDTALRKLSEVALKAVREVDIVGRLGGEEFAVLLPETDGEMAFEVAERFRSSIANTEVLLESGAALRFTISIGVASLGKDCASFDALLSQADQALYEAKNAGRNRVCGRRN